MLAVKNNGACTEDAAYLAIVIKDDDGEELLITEDDIETAFNTLAGVGQMPTSTTRRPATVDDGWESDTQFDVSPPHPEIVSGMVIGMEVNGRPVCVEDC